MRGTDNAVGLSATKPRQLIRFTGLSVMLITVSACTQGATKPDLILCSDPRPEVCTMDYTPVCALRAAAATEQWKTYANACTACSDEAVKGYRENACATDDR